MNLYIYALDIPTTPIDPTGRSGCNWWDLVCGWNSLSTGQKATVIAVAVVAIVVVSCFVGCEGLLFAPEALAGAGFGFGASGVSVGALGLSTEFAGIGYGAYEGTSIVYSWFDSLTRPAPTAPTTHATDTYTGGNPGYGSPSLASGAVDVIGAPRGEGGKLPEAPDYWPQPGEGIPPARGKRICGAIAVISGIGIAGSLVPEEAQSKDLPGDILNEAIVEGDTVPMVYTLCAGAATLLGA